MKYSVRIGTNDVEVEVIGDRVEVDGHPAAVTFQPLGPASLYQVGLDGAHWPVSVRRADDRWVVQVDGISLDVDVMDARIRRVRELTSAGGAGSQGEVITAPMPGLVVRVEVQEGEQVTAGSGVIVLEAMKMENELTSRLGGRVVRVRVEPGQAVEKGAVLVELAPVDHPLQDN